MQELLVSSAADDSCAPSCRFDPEPLERAVDLGYGTDMLLPLLLKALDQRSELSGSSGGGNRFCFGGGSWRHLLRRLPVRSGHVPAQV